MKGLAGNLATELVVKALNGIVDANPLEINAGMKLIDITEEVGRAYGLFEGKRRKLLQEWTKKDKEGRPVIADGVFKFDGNDQEEYNKAFSLIANEDIEYSFDPIPLKLFTHRASGKPYVDKDREPITILPSILAGLKPILEDETGDGKADSE